MSLLEQIQQDLSTAIKARDESKVSTLRMIKTSLDRYQKDQQKPLNEISEQKILNTMMKQRQDSITLFKQGNREDLVTKEQAEIDIIKSYMPQEATQEEMNHAVDQAFSELLTTGSQNVIGQVMKAAQLKLTGKRVDGKILSEMVKNRIAHC